jgi:hypothetical protein
VPPRFPTKIQQRNFLTTASLKHRLCRSYKNFILQKMGGFSQNFGKRIIKCCRFFSNVTKKFGAHWKSSRFHSLNFAASVSESYDVDQCDGELRVCKGFFFFNPLIDHHHTLLRKRNFLSHHLNLL